MSTRILSLFLAALLLWSDFATHETPALAAGEAVLSQSNDAELVDAHHVDDLPAQAQADAGDTDQLGGPSGQPLAPAGRPLLAATVPAGWTQAPPDTHRRPPKPLPAAA